MAREPEKNGYFIVRLTITYSIRADVELEMMTDMDVDKVTDIEVDIVANMEVATVTYSDNDININMEILFGHGLLIF